MKELISRQVVLAEVREWLDQRGIDGAHLLAVLEQIPSEGGWISVEEKLPDRPGEVFVTIAKYTGVAFFRCDGTFETWSGMVFKPGDMLTHWMPKFAPAEEDEK